MNCPQVKEHPRLWDAADGEYSKAASRKEDWGEVMANLQEAFRERRDALSVGKAYPMDRVRWLWRTALKRHEKIQDVLERGDSTGKLLFSMLWVHKYLQHKSTI